MTGETEDVSTNAQCMEALLHSGTHLVQVRVPHDLWQQIKAEAKSENRSMNNLVVTILRDHIGKAA